MARDLTDCPYYLISRCTFAVTTGLRRAFARAGLPRMRPAYLGVLMCLWREDGQRMVDLGRLAGLEPSSMTGLLDRMQDEGLLGRNEDPDDRRAYRISLTAEGKAAHKPVLKVVDQELKRMLGAVSEDDLTRLKKTLRRVLANASELP